MSSFAYGGEQRSFSYHCFHADSIPNSLISVLCPSVKCQWVMFQNDPDSTGNIVLGSDRLSVVGNGIELEPGDVTGWIATKNLNWFYHKELDATTYLNYMLVGCAANLETNYLLLENGNYLLQEDGEKIVL